MATTDILAIAAQTQQALRAPNRTIDVRDFDSRDASLYPGDGKQDIDVFKDAIEPILDELQEKLFANGRTNPEAPSILLILQGMDTAGKGGVIRHVIGMVDPQGVKITGFKKPTAEERAHDFLWRIERALPEPGIIGIFDRSQYEDVLIQRVEQMAPAEEIERRYAAINEFESNLVANGTRVIKCFLNVSRSEQKERLTKRLHRRDKYWKYNPGDVDVAHNWDDYMEAYSIALTRCNTEAAPWYIIPADRKWYRNWAVAQLLLAELADLDLAWPGADFDVPTELQRVAALPEV